MMWWGVGALEKNLESPKYLKFCPALGREGKVEMENGIFLRPDSERYPAEPHGILQGLY